MEQITIVTSQQHISASLLHQNQEEGWKVYCAINLQKRTDDMAGKPIFYFFVEAPGYDAPACVGYGPFSACNRILAQLEDYLLGIPASELNKVRTAFRDNLAEIPRSCFEIADYGEDCDFDLSQFLADAAESGKVETCEVQGRRCLVMPNRVFKELAGQHWRTVRSVLLQRNLVLHNEGRFDYKLEAGKSSVVCILLEEAKQWQ